MNQGWQCPKCLKVWAPHVGACGACNSRQTIEPPRRPEPPYIGSPIWGQEYPGWNFNGDDLSYT